MQARLQILPDSSISTTSLLFGFLLEEILSMLIAAEHFLEVIGESSGSRKVEDLSKLQLSACFRPANPVFFE